MYKKIRFKKNLPTPPYIHNVITYSSIKPSRPKSTHHYRARHPPSCKPNSRLFSCTIYDNSIITTQHMYIYIQELSILCMLCTIKCLRVDRSMNLSIPFYMLHKSFSFLYANLVWMYIFKWCVRRVTFMFFFSLYVDMFEKWKSYHLHLPTLLFIQIHNFPANYYIYS